MLTLARGMLIFRAFAERQDKTTVAQMAVATGLKRSTVYRCLYTLSRLGYLQNEGSLFSPLVSTVLLGKAYFTRGHWEVAVQPIIDGLRDQFGLTCGLTGFEDGHAHYVVVAQSRGSLTFVASVGRRLPAYCTAIGRIFLAELEPQAVRDYLRGVTPVPYTAHTTTTPEALYSRIEDARRDGYSIASQEIDLGVRVVAVPVRSRDGQVVAALMCGGELSVIADDKIHQQYLPQLRKVAAEIGLLWDSFDRREPVLPLVR